jgi:signal transduction histidine kinase
MKFRTPLVYVLLMGTWLATLVWQQAEHDRVATRLRASLTNRAANTSKSLDIMLRALRSFGSFIPGSRLESALEEMVKSEELLAVSLYNRSFDVIAAAGVDATYSPAEMPVDGELWLSGRALFQHAVDLGISTFGTNNRPREAIVMQPRSEEDRERERLRNDDPVERRKRLEQVKNSIEERLRSIDTETNGSTLTATNQRPRRSFLFRRPSSMSEADFEAVRQQGGVYGALFQLNTAGIQASIDQDMWLRTCIVAFAFVAFAAMGMAWRNVTRSGEIEMRLVRAREQNTHLKDMNLAAAGLAHETRNPLNLIRGMAQMISKEDNASEPIRRQCSDITGEVDRVTGQLNEFINFSKPPEIRRTAVNLGSIIEDVTRPLKGELDDQQVTIEIPPHPLRIEADEKMLRQVVFNILLNSLQAMTDGGRIVITTGQADDGAWIEISDNGPGIAAEHREKIFQPYFTTREKEGTGLGLAIVRQIILAHGWEIAFQPAETSGTKFRITRIKAADD